MYIYHEKLTIGTVEMWSSQKLVGVQQLRRSRAAATRRGLWLVALQIRRTAVLIRHNATSNIASSNAQSPVSSILQP